MIEGVYRALRCCWDAGKYGGNQRFDIACLYLDVQGGAHADRLKDFFECRKRDARRKLEILELGQGQGSDCATGDRRVRGR
jgi:hypothetical protein